MVEVNLRDDTLAAIKMAKCARGHSYGKVLAYAPGNKYAKMAWFALMGQELSPFYLLSVTGREKMIYQETKRLISEGLA